MKTLSLKQRIALTNLLTPTATGVTGKYNRDSLSQRLHTKESKQHESIDTIY